MFEPSIGQDLHDLVSIVLRLGYRALAFAIGCAFLYQAYEAWRSALLGVNSNASAPVPNPKEESSRFGAAAWGTIALSIGLGSFSVLIFGGDAMLGVILSSLRR